MAERQQHRSATAGPPSSPATRDIESSRTALCQLLRPTDVMDQELRGRPHNTPAKTMR